MPWLKLWDAKGDIDLEDFAEVLNVPPVTLGQEASLNPSCGHAFHLASLWINNNNNNNHTWYLNNTFTVCQMLSHVLSYLILIMAPLKVILQTRFISIFRGGKWDFRQNPCENPDQVPSQETWSSELYSMRSKCSSSKSKSIGTFLPSPQIALRPKLLSPFTETLAVLTWCFFPFSHAWPAWSFYNLSLIRLSNCPTW